MRDVGAFLRTWTAAPTAEALGGWRAERIARSQYGNYAENGAVASGSAPTIPRWHPAFRGAIEPGVRDLVLTMAWQLGWPTYTSCEGHRYVGTALPPEMRHVGVVVADSGQARRVRDQLEFALATVELTADAPYEFVLLDGHLETTEGVTRFPTLDVEFRRTADASWERYFGALDKATTGVTVALERLAKAEQFETGATPAVTASTDPTLRVRRRQARSRWTAYTAALSASECTDQGSRREELYLLFGDWLRRQSRLPYAPDALDVMCGPGKCAAALLRTGAKRVTGLDADQSALRSARRRVPSRDRARFERSDVRALLNTPADATHDLAVFAYEVLNALGPDDAVHVLRAIANRLGKRSVIAGDVRLAGATLVGHQRLATEPWRDASADGTAPLSLVTVPWSGPDGWIGHSMEIVDSLNGARLLKRESRVWLWTAETFEDTLRGGGFELIALEQLYTDVGTDVYEHQYNWSFVAEKRH